jgi:hypothetical protein
MSARGHRPSPDEIPVPFWMTERRMRPGHATFWMKKRLRTEKSTTPNVHRYFVYRVLHFGPVGCGLAVG